MKIFGLSVDQKFHAMSRFIQNFWARNEKTKHFSYNHGKAIFATHYNPQKAQPEHKGKYVQKVYRCCLNSAPLKIAPILV